MKITILGYGYVGRAFDAFFIKRHDVSIYDIQKIESDRYFSDVKKSDLYAICVPTNRNSNGSVDLTCVEDAFSKIYDCDKSAFVLIKSTIPPRTTERLQRQYPQMHIVFSPEYIGESPYYLGSPYDWSDDVIKTPFFIFGGNQADTSRMVNIFQEIAGPNKQYFQATSTEAEITKYMENTFFASKIVFCNEFYNICKTYGVDYTIVRELWLADTRINKNHTLIFNQDKPFCFGGKCLPKDLSGIIFHANENGYSPNFLKAVQDANTKKSNIFMFHRIAFGKSHISPIYFARKMCVSIYQVENLILAQLKTGKQFGSIEDCLEFPDKYFLLSFDDGYKEHLQVAEYLRTRFSIPKHSLLFSIPTDFLLKKSYGMDALYALAEDEKLEQAFGYFNLEYKQDDGTLENLKTLKTHYIKCPRKRLEDFKKCMGIDLSDLFLNEEDIKKLSKIATICSHGMAHRSLTEHLSDSAQEISQSKEILQNISGQNIDIFCYPEGKHTVELVSIVKEAYRYALAISGTSEAFCLSRTDGGTL